MISPLVGAVVGVNQFQVEETITLEQLKVDPQIETRQRERLAALRQSRDANRVRDLLTRLEDATRGSENPLPLFVE